MDKKDLSIATITWARDEQEEELLRKSLTQLATLGINVFITDGGSEKSFLEFLGGFSNFHVTQLKGAGLWAQAQKSLVEAQPQGKFVLYTEPDKYDFFKQLKSIIEEIIVNDQTGIFLASRSKDGFSSFPAFQQMTETTINNCLAEVTGKTIDYTYGPFLINSELIPSLELVTEKIAWGWRPYAFVLAHKKGLAIESKEDNFYCPPDQREDTPKERLYRMRQLEENIKGILLASK